MSDLHLSMTRYLYPSYIEGLGARCVIWLRAETRDVDHSQAQPTEIQRITPDALAAELTQAHLRGVTLRGDEPFEQAEALAELTRQVQHAARTVIIYSGFTLARLKERAVHERPIRMLLHHTDLLISSSSVHPKPVIHDLSGREPVESLGGSNLVEVRQNLTPRPLSVSYTGWPRGVHQLERAHVDPEVIELSLTQAIGAQWLDDWFRRDRFSSDFKQHWECDAAYWSVALERARVRCVRWLLEMSQEGRLPRSIGGEARELNILDIDPSVHPLRFGPETQLILGPPSVWGDALRRAWRPRHRARPYTERMRWRAPDLETPPYWGDWVLLASWWLKLTRPQVSAAICVELLERPRAERARIREWLMEGSPLCALLNVIEGAPLLVSLDTSNQRDVKLIEGLDHIISLISAGLSAHWSALLTRERSADGFTGDGWRTLFALTKLNDWAADRGAYALGESSLIALHTGLTPLSPTRYFQVSAPDFAMVTAERERRLKVVNIAERWRGLITEARALTYGDIGFEDAQLLSRYATRWEALWTPFDRLRLHAAKLLDEVRAGQITADDGTLDLDS